VVAGVDKKRMKADYEQEQKQKREALLSERICPTALSCFQHLNWIMTK